jgi:hypothetical protein
MNSNLNRRGIDAGIRLSDGGGSTGGNASIGDRVWHDKNGDGIQNSGEPGLSGIQVKLRSCNGIWQASTNTTSGGAYQFANLAPEKYLVEFVLPGGARFSPTMRGTDRNGDSDVDPATGYTRCLDMNSKLNRPGIDAGIRL